MNRYRWIAAAAAAALLVVLAVWWSLFHGRPSTDAGAVAAPPAVATSVVTFGILRERVSAHGRVGPPSGAESKLAFAGSGILSHIDVAVGEAVAAGAPLAEYAGADVTANQAAAARARVAAARAHLQALERGAGSPDSDHAAAQSALRASQAKVELDQRTLAREQELYRGGVAAQKDVDAAAEQLALDASDLQANEAKLAASSSGVGDALAQARSDYESAVSDLAAAQRALANMTLRAPSDAVVVAILKHVGEAVDPSTPAIEIGPAAGNTVTLTVPGVDGRRVRVGDAVEVVDTELSVAAAGRVVAVVPSVDPATQNTTVVVSGVPSGSVNGDAVDASIVVGVRRGLLVPAGAIVSDPQTGAMLVFVRKRDKDGNEIFSAQRVGVAAGDARTALVTGAIRPGDRIATTGAFDLLAPSGGS